MMEEAQYEDIKRGYQDILEDLASLLDQEGLDFIFGKIEESLMENIKNEGYFSFLRKFFCKSTLKTRKLLLEQISSRTVELNSIPSSQDLDGNPNDAEEKKSQDIKKTIITQKDDEDDSFLNEENLNLSKFFGIDLIWRLIQDSSPFTVVKINDCLEFFIELLKKANIKVLFRKYFELCLENIFSNKSVYQSLYLMKEILNSIQNEWSNLDFALFLTRIQDRYGFNLIDIILKEMLVSHAQRGNKEANSQNSQSRYSYSEIYKMHLNLFQFLKNYTIGNTRSKENTIQNNNNAIINNVNKSNNNSNNGVNKNNNLDNNPFNITYEHINTLWSLSVIQAHHPNEAIEFLKSFLNESSNFSPSIMKCFDYVFLLFCKYLEEKISSNQLKTVSDDIFSCFFLYYKHCNINHKNFELTSDNIYNLCEEDSIIGFKTLWSLFLACEQEKILHDCIQHLVMVYGTLGIDIFGKRTEIFRIFLKKCLYNLREAIQHKKVNLVQKVLRLIDTFTVTIEKKKFSYAKSRNNSNYILIKPNNEKFESFHFNATLPVKYLRLKIAEVNELPLESFIIVFNQANMEISRDYDDHKTSCFVNNDLLLYCVLQEIKLESPKVMLSENMEFIKTFFELFELDFTGWMDFYFSFFQKNNKLKK